MVTQEEQDGRVGGHTSVAAHVHVRVEMIQLEVKRLISSQAVQMCLCAPDDCVCVLSGVTSDQAFVQLPASAHGKLG